MACGAAWQVFYNSLRLTPEAGFFTTATNVTPKKFLWEMFHVKRQRALGATQTMIHSTMHFSSKMFHVEHDQQAASVSGMARES